jgi:hypothetical protein
MLNIYVVRFAYVCGRFIGLNRQSEDQSSLAKKMTISTAPINTKTTIQ